MGVKFDYTLTRSKRKSISIQIKDSEVYVKAPPKVSIEKIEAFICLKEKWIEKKLRESAKQHAMLSDIFSFDRFEYLGNNILPQKSNVKKIAVENGKLLIPINYYNGYSIDKTNKFVSALKKFYQNAALQYLSERLNKVSLNLKLPYSQFNLTNAKTKWGSCDSYNRIRLNWRLILLSPALIDYVIVHELVHTVEHNHSKRFWNCCAKIYPDYKEAIACLKKMGLLMDYLR